MTFANLSGGRDSSAMVVRWLESGEKLDFVIFCDTGFEFAEMYAYVDKLDNFLYKNYGMNITRLDSRGEIEKWAFGQRITRGERAGQFRGIPRRLGNDYCTRETKIYPSKRFVLSKSQQKFRNCVLIGYTHAEVQRGRVSNLDYAIARYPLAEWHWNERECEEFLKARGIANPLYRHFSRTGCYLCPKQSMRSLYKLFRHYPQYFQKMLEMESRASALDCVNTRFFGKPLEQIAEDFKYRQDTLFSDDYVELETCFCK